MPQLGLRFLVDSNSWNVNEKPQNCEADAQEYWASWLLTMSLDGLACVFQLGYLIAKFQVPNFLFSSLWQYDRGKYNVPTATEDLGEKVCRIKIFRANLG